MVKRSPVWGSGHASTQQGSGAGVVGQRTCKGGSPPHTHAAGGLEARFLLFLSRVLSCSFSCLFLPFPVFRK